MQQNRNLESKILSLTSIITSVLRERHPDKANAIKSNDLIHYLKDNSSMNVRGQDLRAIIGHIRQKDLLKPGFIISDVANGYWYSTDQAEMDAFIDQQLNRMSNQFDNIKALHQRIRHNKKDKTSTQFKLF